MNAAFRAGLAAVVTISLLSACAEPPPPPPPPPPAPPPISLAPKVIEQASAYRYYINRASAISPTFVDGPGIAEALRTGAAYEPKQFLQGAIAYGAVVALQDTAFVAGVKQYVGTEEQRRTIAYEIMKDPAYVVGIQGSGSAAGLVVKALADDGGKFYEAGKTVKQAAYDVQKQPWSKVEIAGRDLRLSQTKALSATPVVGDVAETARLQQAALGGGSLGLTASPAAPPFTPVVIRSLSIAALAILGYGGESNVGTLDALMVEPNTTSCANMAKLNLYQCLAVAKPYYEDVFCLGQHGMMDTARCVIKASGQPEPYEAKFVPQVRTNASYTVTPAKKPAKKPATKR